MVGSDRQCVLNVNFYLQVLWKVVGLYKQVLKEQQQLLLQLQGVLMLLLLVITMDSRALVAHWCVK
jgi:hypothetical protein